LLNSGQTKDAIVDIAIKETRIIQTILNFLDFLLIYNMLPRKRKKVKGGISINKKTISIFFWSLFCVWFVGFLLYSNVKMFQKRTELNKELQKIDSDVESLTKEKDLLKFRVGETSSKEYLEKVAREDLGMQKPGEKVVIIKKSDLVNEIGKENISILQKISNWFNSIKEMIIKPE
jgi:cell division protein FtsL